MLNLLNQFILVAVRAISQATLTILEVIGSCMNWLLTQLLRMIGWVQRQLKLFVRWLLKHLDYLSARALRMYAVFESFVVNLLTKTIYFFYLLGKVGVLYSPGIVCVGYYLTSDQPLEINLKMICGGVGFLWSILITFLAITFVVKGRVVTQDIHLPDLAWLRSYVLVLWRVIPIFAGFFLFMSDRDAWYLFLLGIFWGVISLLMYYAHDGHSYRGSDRFSYMLMYWIYPKEILKSLEVEMLSLFHSKRYQEALQTINISIQLSPTAHSIGNRARIFTFLKLINEARQDFMEAARLDPITWSDELERFNRWSDEVERFNRKYDSLV